MMDFKTFRKKLIRNRFSKTASLILAVLTVAFLILGYSIFQPDKSTAVKLADRKESIGSYAYVDVYVFDDWVCKSGDDTYYVLYDSSGGVYLSVIPDRTIRKMTKQAAGSDDYTYYFDGSYRLYGVVKRTSVSVISMVEDAYGISSKEFKEYLGSGYIDTADTPDSNTAWMWFTFAIFSGLFALIFLTIWTGSERLFNKENRDYSDEEFSEAARLMDETDKKQKLIFGDDFIINRDTGMLVRYRDILWIHLVNVSINGVKAGRVLGLHTWKRNYFKISPAIRDAEQQLNDMIDVITERNPGVLIGYTKENRETYDRMTKT